MPVSGQLFGGDRLTPLQMYLGPEQLTTVFPDLAALAEAGIRPRRLIDRAALTALRSAVPTAYNIRNLVLQNILDQLRGPSVVGVAGAQIGANLGAAQRAARENLLSQLAARGLSGSGAARRLQEQQQRSFLDQILEAASQVTGMRGSEQASFLESLANIVSGDIGMLSDLVASRIARQQRKARRVAVQNIRENVAGQLVGEGIKAVIDWLSGGFGGGGGGFGQQALGG